MAKATKKEETTMTESLALHQTYEDITRPGRSDNMGGAKLAVVKGGAMAMASHDELDGMEVDFTGLEEVDASDFRLASIVFNFGGVDEKTGEQVPKNRFFNTVTEEISSTANLALLVMHKSRGWTEFVQDQGTVRRCTSWDNIDGRMLDGSTRKCEGCPDYQWTQSADGKRKRNCSDVHNVVASDLDHGSDLVMLRLKKTSLGPWTSYLNKHFLGKRVVAGNRTHYPLFAFQTKVTLKLEKNGANAYAVPVFERGEPLDREDVAFCLESARGVKDLYLDRVREVAESTEDGGDGGDPSFAYGANADAFVDTKAEPATATRFE